MGQAEFEVDTSVALKPTVGVVVERESAKAVAEIQAAYTIAKKFPRNEHEAEKRIIVACSRYVFAEKAFYSFPRGGKTVRGPSIRTAEMLARYWGNIDAGFRELERNKGSSLVESYSIDLETNTRFTRQFTVEHRIGLKDNKFKELTDPRDIYEQVANQAQRRTRACILQAIPGFIIEEVDKHVVSTIKKGEGAKPFADRVRDMVKGFAVFGVELEMLEKKLGHKVDLLTQDELVEYLGIFNSLNSKETDRAAWFDVGTPSIGGKAGEVAGKLDAAPLAEEQKFPFEKKVEEKKK